MNDLSVKNLSFTALLTSILFIVPVTGCKKESPEERFTKSAQKAAEYIKSEKWDEARLSLLNAIDAKGDDPVTHFQLGEVFIRLRKIGPAIDQYETTLNLDPNHRDARIRLAAIKLGGSQLEASESDLQKLLEQNPKDIEALMLKASLAKIKGRFKESKEILNKVLETVPKNNLALAALADVTLADGDPATAEILFNKSLEIDPTVSAVRLALADLYVKQNRQDEAQDVLQQLVDKEPKNTSLRFFLGEFLLARGSNEKATEQYQELLKNDPKKHEARDRLYDLLVLRRDNAAAKNLTTELVKLEPTQPGTLYFQGRDLELDGKITEAYDSYIKAVGGLPGFAPLFRRAGIIEVALGKTTEGLEHLNQAVTINPADVGAQITLSRHFVLNKDLGSAKEHLNEVLRRFPRQLGANVLRADIALLEGDLASAEKIYQAVVQNLPNNPVAYFKLGALEETRKNPKAALDYYLKGIGFDQGILIPIQRIAQIISATEGVDKALDKLKELRDKSERNKAEFNAVLANVLLTFGRTKPDSLKDARTYLEQAVNEKPDLLTAYFSLARIDQAEGKMVDAEERYKKIIERQPKHVPSRMLLAMSLEQRKEFKSAIEQYRGILEIDSSFGPAANNLAWLIVSTGNGSIDEALDLALKAKEKLPQIAGVADTLGWVYFKKDAPKAALPVLEDAVELDRKNAMVNSSGKKLLNPEILYHLAVVQSSLDMKDDAKKTAQEALEIGGEQFPFKDELKKIVE